MPSPSTPANARLQEPRKALHQLPPVRHRLVGCGQHDSAGFVLEAERQHLGAHRADLARRKVDDAENLAADEVFRRVVHGDLRGGFLQPDLGAEVDRQFPGGLPRLRKGCRFDDRPDADLDPLEIGIGDGVVLTVPEKMEI